MHCLSEILSGICEGYILYVDSSCEGRALHLLTCIDGNSGFVLYSQKMASENQADLEKDERDR
jgi:hypothetical protein